MPSFLRPIRAIFSIFLDALTFIKLCFRPTTTVAAENLFLRQQLGLIIERKAKPRRASDAIRFTLARLSCLVDWRSALTIGNPDTLICVGIAKASVCLEAQVSATRTTSHSCPVAESTLMHFHKMIIQRKYSLPDFTQTSPTTWAQRTHERVD